MSSARPSRAPGLVLSCPDAVDVAPVSQRNSLQVRDQFVHSNTGIPTLDCMIVLWFGCCSSKTDRFRFESQWILLSENADLIFRL